DRGQPRPDRPTGLRWQAGYTEGPQGQEHREDCGSLTGDHERYRDLEEVPRQPGRGCFSVSFRDWSDPTSSEQLLEAADSAAPGAARIGLGELPGAPSHKRQFV